MWLKGADVIGTVRPCTGGNMGRLSGSEKMCRTCRLLQGKLDRIDCQRIYGVFAWLVETISMLEMGY
jgi:hypothetical protein